MTVAITRGRVCLKQQGDMRELEPVRRPVSLSLTQGFGVRVSAVCLVGPKIGNFACHDAVNGKAFRRLGGLRLYQVARCFLSLGAAHIFKSSVRVLTEDMKQRPHLEETFRVECRTSSGFGISGRCSRNIRLEMYRPLAFCDGRRAPCCWRCWRPPDSCC